MEICSIKKFLCLLLHGFNASDDYNNVFNTLQIVFLHIAIDIMNNAITNGGVVV